MLHFQPTHKQRAHVLDLLDVRCVDFRQDRFLDQPALALFTL